MRTEMTNSPPHSGSSLKGGASKALREESARVGAGPTQSAGAEGDDAGGGFSALLMTLSGDAAGTATVSATPPSTGEDVSATDTGSKGKSPETSASAQALGVDAALLAMPQRGAAGEVSGEVSSEVTGVLSALAKGVNSVGPTLAKVTSPLSSAMPNGMPAASDAEQSTASPRGTSNGEVFVSTAAVAQQANAGGVDLSPRDSKNHMNLAQGHGVNGQSHASLVTDQPELLKLSASALEGGAQKSLQKIATTMDGGAVSAPSFQLTDLRTAGASAPEVGSSAATATTVAQQVNYWIGRDVQSAELKLDGLGHSPVEVSISLQGREAHVEFRAEQIEARQIIEQAMPQLKALLQSEGLALAGVSIGSSGAEASFSQAKQPKQPLRQGAARVAELGLMDAVDRTRPGAGRALDLFV